MASAIGRDPGRAHRRDRLVALGLAGRVVGRSARVDERERRELRAPAAREREGHVAAHRESREARGRGQGVEDRADEIGVLVDRRRRGGRRLAAARQVRLQDPEAAGQRARDARPHGAVEGIAVDEDDRAAPRPSRGSGWADPSRRSPSRQTARAPSRRPADAERPPSSMTSRSSATPSLSHQPCAHALGEDLEGRRDRQRAAVGAVGGQGVEDVGDRHDAHRHRDRMARDPLRVARAVEALVVVVHDRERLAHRLHRERAGRSRRPGAPR